MVVFFVTGVTFATWATRVPAVQNQLALSESQLAIALLGLAAGAVAGLLGAGAITVKIGSRAASITGLIVLCGSLPSLAFVPSLATLTTALFMFGAGNSVLDVAMNAQAVLVERAYGRPIFAGFHAFWSIGGLVGSALGAIVAATDIEIHVHFPMIGTAMITMGLFACWRFLHEPNDESRADLPAFTLPNRALLALGVIAFCAFIAEGTVNDWGAVYLTQIAHASQGTAALGYFVFSATMVIGRLTTDRIVEVIGPVRFILVASGISVVGLGLSLIAPSVLAGLIGFALLGLGLAGTIPITFSAAGKINPESAGTAIAAVSTLGYLGFLAGPVVIGALAELLGLRAALITVVVLTALMAVFARATRCSMVDNGVRHDVGSHKRFGRSVKNREAAVDAGDVLSTGEPSV